MSTSGFQALSGAYFSDLDGGNKVYCLIDPVPFPVFGNSQIKDVIHETLPGIGLSGSVESGRVVHFNLGGNYTQIVDLEFKLADDEGSNTDFVDILRTKRDSMEDFIYSPNDGSTQYRVSFTGADGLVFYKQEYPSTLCKIKLLVLERIS
jgi:hypothetical protein